MHILLSLFLVIAAVAASVYFAGNPGKVEIVWQGWLIDTSVGVLVAVAALFALLVSVLALTITGLRRAPVRVRRRWRRPRPAICRSRPKNRRNR